MREDGPNDRETSLAIRSGHAFGALMRAPEPTGRFSQNLKYSFAALQCLALEYKTVMS